MSRMRRLLDNCPLLYILFALYLALLLRLTVLRDGLLPLHPLRGGVMDLLPLAYYLRFARRSLSGLLLRELAGNIVGFAPLGAFVVWRRPEAGRGGALWTGAAVSACIEGLQYLLGVGRMSTGDVALNALGALLGAAAMETLRTICDGKEDTR